MLLDRATKGLLWKETRQLIPLIGMLIGVGLLMLFIASTTWVTGAFEAARDYFPWMLPVLFSVGAGAVLVGQEREQGTIWWLASHPIPPNRLISAKIAAAMIGLVLIWGISLLLVAAIGGHLGSFMDLMNPRAASTTDVLIITLHTVFILGCGLFTAWWFGNSFAALIAIVPMMTIPSLVAQALYLIWYLVTGNWRIRGELETALMLVLLLLGISVVYWLVYYVGGKKLGPAKAPGVDDSKILSVLDAWRPTATSVAPSDPFQYSINSILWQMLRHSRWILLGIGTLMVIGSWAMPNILRADISNTVRYWIVAAAIAGWLATTWLGLLVFANDGNSKRMRFLAERGVSPSIVWLGRQLVPVSLISVAVLAYAVEILQGGKMIDYSLPFPSVVSIALMLWITYSISQWAGQLLSMLGISVIIAPILSMIGFYWLVFSAIELRSPLWLLILCGCLPLLSTFLSMRPFMDGNQRIKFWGIATVAALLFVTIPAIPFAANIASSPAMPKHVRKRLIGEANQIRLQTPIQLTWSESPISNLVRFVDFDGVSGQQAMEAFHQTDFGPSSRFEDLKENQFQNQGLSADSGMVTTMISSATLASLAYEQEPENQDAKKLLADWISGLVRITRGMRASQKWQDQESADVIEIWLLKTLARDSMEPVRNDLFYNDAIQLLEDSNGRSQARRCAVLASWKRTVSERNHDRAIESTGGFVLGNNSHSASYRYLTNHRTTDAVVDAAIRLIDAGSADKPTESIRRELHRLVVGLRIRFEDGPYSKRMRAGVSVETVATVGQAMRYPGNQWYAPWEKDALQLANRQQRTNDGSPVNDGESE